MITDKMVDAALEALNSSIKEQTDEGCVAWHKATALRAALEAALAAMWEPCADMDGEPCPMCDQAVWPEEEPGRVDFSEPPDRPDCD